MCIGGGGATVFVFVFCLSVVYANKHSSSIGKLKEAECGIRLIGNNMALVTAFAPLPRSSTYICSQHTPGNSRITGYRMLRGTTIDSRVKWLGGNLIEVELACNQHTGCQPRMAFVMVYYTAT